MAGNPEDILRLTECPQCRYPLSGLPRRHHCPECGFAYSELMFIVPVSERGMPPAVFKGGVWLPVLMGAFVTIMALGVWLLPKYSTIIIAPMMLYPLYWVVAWIAQVRHGGVPGSRMVCNQRGVAIERINGWSSVIPYELIVELKPGIGRGRRHTFRMRASDGEGFEVVWADAVLHATPQEAARVWDEIDRRIEAAKGEADDG